MRETIDGVSIGSQTLMGVDRSLYPIERGNCFDMWASDGKAYKILNFNVENLMYCISRGISLPIKISVLNETAAVVHDERIPHNFYAKDFCSICAPKSLWSLPQILRHERSIACEEIVEHDNGSVSLNWKKSPKFQDAQPYGD